MNKKNEIYSIPFLKDIFSSSYSGRNISLDKKMDEIFINLKRCKSENPKATEKELNDYANSLFSKHLVQSKEKINTSTDMDGYITDYLNEKEKELYNKNKFKALLCMGNGKLALEYAEDNYITSKLHNGNGDAFRHTLWNYGMAIDVGYDFAKQWGDAHEYGAANSPQIEQGMDLFNNAVGIYLYNCNPNPGGIPNMINIVKSTVNKGGCQIIRYGKIVNSNSYGLK